MTTPDRQISETAKRTVVKRATVLVVAMLASGCVSPRVPEPVVIFSEDPGLPGIPTTDPAATRAYVAGLTFSTTPIVSSVPCHNGVRATIQIFPEVRSHHLDAEHAKKQGRIVARIRNAGAGACNDLHLDPGETAYWWMGPYRGFALTTDFWRIPAATTDPIRHLAQTGETKHFRLLQRSLWDATISDSLRHAPGDDNGDVQLAMFGHNSTWLACLDGCCESAGLTEAFF